MQGRLSFYRIARHTYSLRDRAGVEYGIAEWFRPNGWTLITATCPEDYRRRPVRSLDHAARILENAGG